MQQRGATLALVALALAGCGAGDGSGSGELVWEREPRVVTPGTLPDDRILSGTVRNDSLRPVELTAAKDLRLVDARGKRLGANAIFLAGFAHGLYPPTREPELPDSELRRLGRKARIEPGKTAPLTVSWRVEPGRRARRIEYPGGTLSVPAR